MSVERDGDQCMLVCESCGAETDTSDDFHSLVSSARADGRKVVKPDGTWQHFCECCEPVSERESALQRTKRMFGKR